MSKTYLSKIQSVLFNTSQFTYIHSLFIFTVLIGFSFFKQTVAFCDFFLIEIFPLIKCMIKSVQHSKILHSAHILIY